MQAVDKVRKLIQIVKEDRC